MFWYIPCILLKKINSKVFGKDNNKNLLFRSNICLLKFWTLLNLWRYKKNTTNFTGWLDLKNRKMVSKVRDTSWKFNFVKFLIEDDHYSKSKSTYRFSQRYFGNETSWVGDFSRALSYLLRNLIVIHLCQNSF